MPRPKKKPSKGKKAEEAIAEAAEQMREGNSHPMGPRHDPTGQEEEK